MSLTFHFDDIELHHNLVADAISGITLLGTMSKLRHKPRAQLLGLSQLRL